EKHFTGFNMAPKKQVANRGRGSGRGNIGKGKDMHYHLALTLQDPRMMVQIMSVRKLKCRYRGRKDAQKGGVFP
ncbi:hypothetical protein Ancab_004145, partial [Ancistrocladus abbreviatus]